MIAFGMVVLDVLRHGTTQGALAQALPRPDFHGEKVADRETCQCAFKKVDQRVGLVRSGDGSIPLRFSTFATVPRPTWCPTFERAP